MKRSQLIRLLSIPILSFMVTSCIDGVEELETTNAVCAVLADDGSGEYVQVDESYCREFSGSHSAYVYHYGAEIRNGRVYGGTTLKPKGKQITTQSGRVIQRGGFGTIGRSGSSAS